MQASYKPVFQQVFQEQGAKSTCHFLGFTVTLQKAFVRDCQVCACCLCRKFTAQQHNVLEALLRGDDWLSEPLAVPESVCDNGVQQIEEEVITGPHIWET